jgi:DnaK suppressor protein
MLARNDKEYFRGLLIHELDKVLKKAKTSSGGTIDSTVAAADIIDQASTEIDNVLSLRIRERESRLARKIKEALAKLEDGTYGICEECGKEISEGRLRARPVARFCIQCKEKQEYEEKLRGL